MLVQDIAAVVDDLSEDVFNLSTKIPQKINFEKPGRHVNPKIPFRTHFYSVITFVKHVIDILGLRCESMTPHAGGYIFLFRWFLQIPGLGLKHLKGFLI